MNRARKLAVAGGLSIATAAAVGQPSVLAAPDLRAYRSPADAPGTTLQVGTFTSDDGVLAGSHLVGTGCGDGGVGEVHAVVANPANQAFTASSR